MNKTPRIFLAVALTVGMAFSVTASATTFLYTDRATFLSEINSPLTDTFNSGHDLINSEADMEALSVASINYFSTGFDSDYNIVSSFGGSGSLCWGCNGSGIIDLSSTTIGSSSGVYAFGADVLFNEGDYNAFITLGDNSQVDIDLGDGDSFFGIASDQLIKMVEIAHTRGAPSEDGSVVLDNVTISASGDRVVTNQVPEPASLALLGLGLLGLSANRRRKVA